MHLNCLFLDLLGFGIYYKPGLSKYLWIFLNYNWVEKWNSGYMVENQELYSLVNLLRISVATLFLTTVFTHHKGGSQVASCMFEEELPGGPVHSYSLLRIITKARGQDCICSSFSLS